MLQRIIAIKNVGRFQNSGAVGDVTFRRCTMIFAENGRGKTTLCAILRSLHRNDAAYVLGRATLGSAQPPEVQLLLSVGPVAFRGGAWQRGFDQVAVFDGTYVSENVFAGDAVDTEHRRNLYRVIIGAEGVQNAAQITEIDTAIAAKNREIRELRASFQALLSPGQSFETFIALTPDPQVDAKIEGKKLELQAAQRSVQLQQRQALSAVSIPVFPPAFAALLAKKFATLAADAERRVNDHLTKHKMTARGGPWVTEGLRYVAVEACPFCDQSLARVDLIADYKAFFGQDYNALRDEVSALERRLETEFGERIAAGIEAPMLNNVAHVEFWKQYCAFEAPKALAVGVVANTMRALREAAQVLLTAKAGAPLDAVAPDEAFTNALVAFEMLRTDLGTYNAAVAGINAAIAAKKRDAQAADGAAIERAIKQLESRKARHEVAVNQRCVADGELHRQKLELEQQKAQVRGLLDAHTVRVIERYGESINRHLRMVNAGFRITTPTHTYRGGSPSTSYQIVINQNAIDLGDPSTPNDRPSFKNTLSAGDRSTLALAFFLAELEQDANRAQKVVVFDDPFTSLDGFRRNHTVHQIYKCLEHCAQVVVLSHDPGFLKLLWDRVAPADRKAIQLARVGETNTAIAEWDLERAVRALYTAQVDDLLRFYNDNVGEPRDIIQKMRPVLEGFCRNLFPSQFGEQEALGTMVGKIRAAGAAHTLFPLVDELDEFNHYCRRYHHAENPHAATEVIDDAELQGYVRRTLGLVGHLL